MTAITVVKPRLYACLTVALALCLGLLVAVRTPAVDAILMSGAGLGLYIAVAIVLAMVLSHRSKAATPVTLGAARSLAVAEGLLVGVFMVLVQLFANTMDLGRLPLVLAYAGFVTWGLTSLMKLEHKLASPAP